MRSTLPEPKHSQWLAPSFVASGVAQEVGAGPERVGPLLAHRAFGVDPHRCIVFLHGFMGSSDDWLPIVRLMGDRIRAVVVDLPGHGGTPLPSNPGLVDMNYVVSGLNDLLDHLGIGSCTVLGYSMGGRIALHYALLHPDRCARLILESAGPGLRSTSERRERRESDSRLASELDAGDFSEFLKKWYDQPIFASLRRRPDLLPTLIERRLQNDPASLAHVLRTLGTGNQESLWDELPALGMPALALAGSLDGRYATAANEMEASSPWIRAELIADAGHIIHLEQPERFTEAVLAFHD